jgi:hypothetical protein
MIEFWRIVKSLGKAQGQIRWNQENPVEDVLSRSHEMIPSIHEKFMGVD